jgi:hypothetical protein
MLLKSQRDLFYRRPIKLDEHDSKQDSCDEHDGIRVKFAELSLCLSIKI